MNMRLQVALALALVVVAHQTRASPITRDDYLSEDLSLEEINRLIAQREASSQPRPRPPAPAAATSTTAAPVRGPADGLADEMDLETINRLISQRDAKEATGGVQQPRPQKVTPPVSRHQQPDDSKDQARLLEMREQCRLAAEVRSHGPTRAPVRAPTKKSPPARGSVKLDAGDIGTGPMGESTTERVLSREEMESRRLMRERCAKAAERRTQTD